MFWIDGIGQQSWIENEKVFILFNHFQSALIEVKILFDGFGIFGRPISQFHQSINMKYR